MSKAEQNLKYPLYILKHSGQSWKAEMKKILRNLLTSSIFSKSIPNNTTLPLKLAK